MTRAFPMTATGVDFPEHIETIFSWPTLLSVIVRISCDALPSQNKRPVITVAIQHDPLPFRQLSQVVLRNLLGDDEILGTGLEHP
jgi:hypothetical protein